MIDTDKDGDNTWKDLVGLTFCKGFYYSLSKSLSYNWYKENKHPKRWTNCSSSFFWCSQAGFSGCMFSNWYMNVTRKAVCTNIGFRLSNTPQISSTCTSMCRKCYADLIIALFIQLFFVVISVWWSAQETWLATTFSVYQVYVFLFLIIQQCSKVVQDSANLIKKKFLNFHSSFCTSMWIYLILNFWTTSNSFR